MAKRMIIMVCAVAGFLAIIGFVKYRQISSAIAQASSFQAPPEAVTTTIAKEDLWQETYKAIGSVTAVNGVTLSADLPGIVETINFKSGDYAEKGQVLAALDTRQEQAQLSAAETRQELARANFERARGLMAEKIISQADYDAASATYEQEKAGVGEIRATIDRKTIRAPFAGILGLRQINLGQSLQSGDPIVALQSLDPIYVNFGVPQQEFAKVRPGVQVRVSTEGGGVDKIGKISANDSVVDSQTRNVQVQATFANRDKALRAGMFVNAEVLLDTRTKIIPLPTSAISYAPYGDSVYIVEDTKDKNGKTYKGVRQQFVKLGSTRGDLVAVLSGIKPGEEVVSSGAFKLRNGAAVVVNNQVQPPTSLTPKPENS